MASGTEVASSPPVVSSTFLLTLPLPPSPPHSKGRGQVCAPPPQQLLPSPVTLDWQEGVTMGKSDMNEVFVVGLVLP